MIDKEYDEPAIEIIELLKMAIHWVANKTCVFLAKKYPIHVVKPIGMIGMIILDCQL